MQRRSMRIANKRANVTRTDEEQPKQEQGNPSQDNLDPNLLAAINQAVATILPQILADVIQAVHQQQHVQEERGNEDNIARQDNQTVDNDGGAQLGTSMYIWLERFQKLRPLSFSSAPTPIDADNWIMHMDKIFDVLGCSDNHKVRLAAYKLEGDAQRWWKTLKLAKGGDAYVEALNWNQFCEVFYHQYCTTVDKEAYAREYSSIRQEEDESVIDYLARFVRLASFVGSAAGTEIEQVEKFKWTVHHRYHSRMINEKFTSVAHAANAAKSIEMELLDFQAGRPKSSKKRKRDGNQVQSPGQQGQSSGHLGGNRSVQWNRNHDGQQGQWQGHNQNWGRQQQWSNRQGGQNKGCCPAQAGGGDPSLIPVAPCNTCGMHHLGRPCYKAIGACFLCGQVGHFARDCIDPSNDGRGGNMGNNGNDDTGGNDGQSAGGREFALTYNQASEAPGRSDLQELDLNECKAYLRKHQLRLSGTKEECIQRINEHLRLKDGRGKALYPRSSFTINCTGDACKGDVVLFTQKVQQKSDKVKKSGKVFGRRSVAGRIVKDSYGAAKQQHTFTIEVLWSKGFERLPPLSVLLVKGRNLYRFKTLRQRWSSEAERSKVLAEKHNRGEAARRKRAKKMAKMEEGKKRQNLSHKEPIQKNKQKGAKKHGAASANASGQKRKGVEIEKAESKRAKSNSQNSVNIHHPNSAYWPPHGFPSYNYEQPQLSHPLYGYGHQSYEQPVPWNQPWLANTYGPPQFFQ